MKANERQEFKQWQVRNKVRRLMTVKGDAGIIIKTALLGALDKQEAAYLFNQEICAKEPDCGCAKLHTIEKSNGLIVIVANWRHGRRLCSVKFMPSRLWTTFRSLARLCESDFESADKVCKQEAGIKFSELQKTALLVLYPFIDREELKILESTASAQIAAYFLQEKQESIFVDYILGWQAAGVILPVL